MINHSIDHITINPPVKILVKLWKIPHVSLISWGKPWIFIGSPNHPRGDPLGLPLPHVVCMVRRLQTREGHAGDEAAPQMGAQEVGDAGICQQKQKHQQEKDLELEDAGGWWTLDAVCFFLWRWLGQERNLSNDHWNRPSFDDFDRIPVSRGEPKGREKWRSLKPPVTSSLRSDSGTLGTSSLRATLTPSISGILGSR